MEVGRVMERVHIFVANTCAHDLILRRPWEAAIWVSYQNKDDGACYLQIQLRDSTKQVQLMVVLLNHLWNRELVWNLEMHGRRTDF